MNPNVIGILTAGERGHACSLFTLLPEETMDQINQDMSHVYLIMKRGVYVDRNDLKMRKVWELIKGGTQSFHLPQQKGTCEFGLCIIIRT